MEGPSPAGAQAERVSHEIFAGSELEDYMRVLQLTGEAPLYPWSIRGFSPREIDRLLPGPGEHPWAERYALATDSAGRPRLSLVAPTVQTTYNSAFAYGANDGASWAGKGLTTALRAGIAARHGPVSLTLAPVAFRSDNAAFPLHVNRNRGEWSEYSDPMFPFWIDLPQRFGDEPYTRVDPGQSTLRVDFPLLSAGVSTANQYWGPATENPLILGNNAAGFPHVFVGTGAPVDLWIARVHGKFTWGRLDQSAYSPMRGETRRFMTGAVAVVQPRGIPGLEVGIGRFFHNVWPSGGLTAANIAQPFQAFLKIDLPVDTLFKEGHDELLKSSPDNQLASAFARWVFPRSGFELYGEFAREDHNYDFRDLVLELTHNSGYMVGFRKAWSRQSEQLLSIRAEVMNAQPAHTTLARAGPQLPFYQHGSARQGHTQYGQALGSAAAYGGAEALLGLDYYHRRGRYSLDWRRTVRNESEEYREAGGFPYGAHRLDAIQALGAEAVLFAPRFDISAGVAAAYNFNRYFEEDVLNLHAVLGLRARL